MIIMMRIMMAISMAVVVVLAMAMTMTTLLASVCLRRHWNCNKVQSVVEIQHLLWLYSPTLERLSLLQLLLVMFVHSSVDADAVLCPLYSLLSFHCSSVFVSLA